tara:strand:+ start:723 stop:926 length:204 start_codon:yes stop_codon:yes gene_type:complete
MNKRLNGFFYDDKGELISHYSGYGVVKDLMEYRPWAVGFVISKTLDVSCHKFDFDENLIVERPNVHL